jgi:transcriptional antiterminator NusG
VNSDNGDRAPAQGVEIEKQGTDPQPEAEGAVGQASGQPAVAEGQRKPEESLLVGEVAAGQEAAGAASAGRPKPADAGAQPEGTQQQAALPSRGGTEEIPSRIETETAVESEPASPADVSQANEPAEIQAQAGAAKEPTAAEADLSVQAGETKEPPARPEAGDSGVTTDVQPISPAGHKWYVVHVYSGYEQKARRSLLERVKQAGMESSFGEVLIPTETVQETRGKSTRITSKTFYPGYIFVQMSMNDHAWHLVRDTPKITGFVGGRYPRPVPTPEIASVVQQVEEGAAKPRPQVQFEQGDQVRVIDGAFANFTGAVEDVKPEKQKVRVLVSIFGRATPVELDYSQVEKTA